MATISPISLRKRGSPTFCCAMTSLSVSRQFARLRATRRLALVVTGRSLPACVPRVLLLIRKTLAWTSVLRPVICSRRVPSKTSCAGPAVCTIRPRAFVIGDHMENFEFRFPGRAKGLVWKAEGKLVGVVGSGNLEVMIEPDDLNGECVATVSTSITGFGETWRQVLTDFMDRHTLSDIRNSINDGGATPAVVSMRLDQAVATYLGAA